MDATRKKQIRRPLLIAGGAFAGFTAVILGFLTYIGMFWGNLRTVVPGQVYRSATLHPDQLDRTIHEDGLRTVISLRGGGDREPWFREEEAVCKRDGVQLERVSLQATTLPKPRELARLVRLLDTAKYPLLFHCQAGSDRTGLAATLYLHLRQGMPLDRAQAEGLTWRYGHFPFSAKPMDDFFDLYRRDAQQVDLRTWILDRYPQIYAEHRRAKTHEASAE